MFFNFLPLSADLTTEKTIALSRVSSISLIAVLSHLPISSASLPLSNSMDYDFRNRAGPPYDSHIPMYRSNTSSSPSPSSHPHHGPSLYPRVGQPSHAVIPPAGRTTSYHQTTSPSSGLGMRVAIKPEYRITAPPQLSPQMGDIPRSTFQFDFELEKKILAEAEKENQNWSRLGLENLSSRTAESNPSSGSATDPVVSKYTASGLSREAVSLAVATFGDNPTKVREFVKGYNLLREMGFSPNSVAEALAMYDNDTDKALAHFLNSST
ncbi:PREDICTED: uncharacterized protein LOC104593421 [Nelumbo nucifera]|uniref:UBA domain-containing protein n=2 Tax=Nelumbo nucifera TaxID=4432 RepID=A0A822ZIT1_NELNU|nr:PREDICTED: uncharacterized protein LOC104593421 [Nelumbo nucifera]DAD43279.1 TPA_asm: hypothetical protein HUJ06_001509 [Nelumbo nucifera]